VQIILFHQLCLLVTHSLTQYDGILLVYCSGFWVDPTKGYSRSYFQAISMLFDDADCFRKVPTFLPFHLSFQPIPANHYVISRNLLLCPFSSSFLTFVVLLVPPDATDRQHVCLTIFATCGWSCFLPRTSSACTYYTGLIGLVRVSDDHLKGKPLVQEKCLTTWSLYVT
jgi:hypothetical protein